MVINIATRIYSSMFEGQERKPLTTTNAAASSSTIMIATTTTTDTNTGTTSSSSASTCTTNSVRSTSASSDHSTTGIEKLELLDDIETNRHDNYQQDKKQQQRQKRKVIGSLTFSAVPTSSSDDDVDYQQQKLNTNDTSTTTDTATNSIASAWTCVTYIKSILFGGLDGILTSFAIVAGSAGGMLEPRIVLILGISNIFADAISMGVGEYLSSKAEEQYIQSVRQHEEHIYESDIHDSRTKVITMYQQRGLSYNDAVTVVDAMSKYKDVFVDTIMMMTQQEQDEIESSSDTDDNDSTKAISQSAKEGMVMFCSFATFGMLPLIGYILIPLLFPTLSTDWLFVSACTVTAMALFLMGSIKSFVSNTNVLQQQQQHWTITGLETMILGGACACVAYIIGQAVDKYTL